MVRATLTSSFGYKEPGQPRKYYGPGKDIEIPAGLALTLGLGSEPEPEPAPVEAPAELPDDFPGREHLEAAGYSTLQAVKALTFDDLVALRGIGKATARTIISSIGELE